MDRKQKIKIFVAHHKPGYIYEDEVYVPIQVGKKNAKVDLGILGDDTGDNISEKNSNYAELTAQYWVWKNYDLSDVDYVGFCHYRRYMTYCYNPNLLNYIGKTPILEGLKLWKERNALFEYDSDILEKNSKNLIEYIKNNPYDIFFPKREYYLGGKLRKHLHMKRDSIFDTIFWGEKKMRHNTKYASKRIFFELYPKCKEIDGILYEEFKDYVPTRRHIFIMRTRLFLDYAKWIFKYLFTLENYINQHHLQTKGIFGEGEMRYIAIVSEPLINYWKLGQERENKIKVQSKSNLVFFTN